MLQETNRPTKEEFLLHKAQEKHKLQNPLRDIILGGQDGLVNALGIIFGIIAAGGDTRILIATVLAASFAESISMGAVAYTSALAQKDYYDSEKKKEYEEIENVPEMEKEEIRQIYRKKGLKGRVLEDVVKTLSSDKKIWVDVMMAEELQLQPVDTKAVLKSSVIVTIATLIGHMVPLMPFFFVTNHVGLIVSLIISGITLFAVGVYQALTLVGSWWKSGLRMLIIGMGAALIGYFIAKLFRTSA